MRITFVGIMALVCFAFATIAKSDAVSFQVLSKQSKNEVKSQIKIDRSPASRGLWMYYHSGSTYGLGHIIGNVSAQNVAVNKLNSYRVGRVYGSYKTLPLTQPDNVAVWNQQLNDTNVDSQLLIGKPHYIFPGKDCRDELLSRIEQRLINFNHGLNSGGATPLPMSMRFDALHMDIEPHAFKSSYYSSNPPTCAPPAMYWKSATRAQLFALFYETLHAVRQLLDGHEHEYLPIYIDLPYWIDTSPNFDWSTTPSFSNGLDWIEQTAQIVDGISFMTYQNNDSMDIKHDIQGERDALQNSIEIRPAVNAKERVDWSSTHTWNDLAQMTEVIKDLESGSCLDDYNVDIHNYKYLFSSWP